MASCGLGAIQWCLFDWQSFATLTAGFLAVLGATIVGFKQAGINRRQVEILAQQVDLEEAKLRAELFQRRLETYEATADFVIHIAALPEDDPKVNERIIRFNTKMRESEFLFTNPNVHSTLVQFWQKGNAARLDKSLARAEYEEKIPGNPDRLQRLLDYPMWGMQTVETLADLFRPDLTILKNEKRRTTKLASTF